MPAAALHPIVEQNRALTDEQVLERVRAGDLPLFEILMRRHNQRLYRITRGILRNDAEAEDAVQQAYLSAYTHLDQFAGEAKFATWLTRIAINEAFARSRKHDRLAEVDLHEEGEVMATSASVTPEDQTSARELSGLLEAAIDGLPEIYRMVVMLREVQQLSTAETAACLEVSEDLVKVRLHRAKAMLRETLASRMEASAPDAFAFLGARCDRIVAAVLGKLGAAR